MSANCSRGSCNILGTSRLVVAELCVWAYQSLHVQRRLDVLGQLLGDVDVLECDGQCAHRFGKLQALLHPRGIVLPVVDVLIAATALAHDCTLVTNDAHFAQAPNLPVVDWLG